MTTPSGPGQFSQRTDKAVYNANQSLPNAGYGENKDYQEIKSGAPMGGAEPAPMSIQQMFQGLGQDVIPLDAESQWPDVPVTDGADAGEGRGSEVLGQGANTGPGQFEAWMPAYLWMADRPYTSDAARNLVRKLKSEM